MFKGTYRQYLAELDVAQASFFQQFNALVVWYGKADKDFKEGSYTAGLHTEGENIKQRFDIASNELNNLLMNPQFIEVQEKVGSEAVLGCPQTKGDQSPVVTTEKG